MHFFHSFAGVEQNCVSFLFFPVMEICIIHDTVMRVYCQSVMPPSERTTQISFFSEKNADMSDYLLTSF
jgi:hypothetical protein